MKFLPPPLRKSPNLDLCTQNILFILFSIYHITINDGPCGARYFYSTVFLTS